MSIKIRFSVITTIITIITFNLLNGNV